jgi:hypothetical protein
MAPGMLDTALYPHSTPGIPSTKSLKTHGWPRSLANGLAWKGSSFQSELDYTLEVTEAHNQELRQALTHFLGK